MKHKYIITAFLIIGSLSFGEGWGEASAQQLSPRYFKKPKTDKFPINTVVPTNRAGQMAGISETVENNGTESYPYLYRLDSTGKYVSNIRFEFSGTKKLNSFEKIIPYIDSLYVIGTTQDNDLGSPYAQGTNRIILKMDTAGNISWTSKFGDVGSSEHIADQVVCTDGGFAFCGDLDIDHLTDSTGIPDNWYNGHKAFITKYDANGTKKINAAFQLPYGQNSAQGYINFNAMAESPDHGFIIAGSASPDYRKYHRGYDGSGTTIKDAGLFLTKVDANGVKLWDKMFVYDSKLQYYKNMYVSDIIPHPAGGYIMVGQAQIGEWTANGSGNDWRTDSTGKQRYDVNNFSGGLMMKVSEAGNLEWIKSFHFPLPFQNYYLGQEKGSGISIFKSVKLSYSSGIPTGFIIGGNDFYILRNPFRDSIRFYLRNDPFAENQTLIVKTDMDGKLLWDREYGSMLWEDVSNDYIVYEEPGGSLLVNTFASTAPTDDLSTKSNLTESGILRLNDKGYLVGPACSLSPKVEVYDDDTVFTYWRNISSVYTATRIKSFQTANVIRKPLNAVTSIGVCGNPVFADFAYVASCSPSSAGVSVAFTDASKGAFYFHYDFGDNTNNVSDSANVHHLYNSGGTYTVSLTVWDKDSSNTNTFKKTITLQEKRNITLHPGNTTICQGATVNLTSTISSGKFPNCNFAFRESGWPPDSAITFTDTTFNSKPLNTTLHFYINTFGNTCAVSDTLVVKVLSSVNMKVKGDSVLCYGETSLLIASGSNTYLWNPENAINDSLKVHPDNTTTYTVSSGQSTVCGSNQAFIKVIVNPLPLADAGIGQTIYPGQQAHLLASGGTSYLWSPTAGLNSISTANPIAEPTLTTMYFVKVTDANGCVNNDSVIVNLKTCGVDMFVPNAFSPNGDNQNDVFYLKTLNNDCIQSITFKIFDRWGNKVFESSDINVGWNGVYNGKAMDSNVFVYFLNATLETGEIITQKGNISLIR